MLLTRRAEKSSLMMGVQLKPFFFFFFLAIIIFNGNLFYFKVSIFYFLCRPNRSLLIQKKGICIACLYKKRLWVTASFFIYLCIYFFIVWANNIVYFIPQWNVCCIFSKIRNLFCNKTNASHFGFRVCITELITKKMSPLNKMESWQKKTPPPKLTLLLH